MTAPQKPAIPTAATIVTGEDPLRVDPLRAGEVLDPPGTGIWAGSWHAVEELHPPRPGERCRWGSALCGAIVTVAAKYGVFDPDRWAERACPACVWTYAIRTDTLADRYARLIALDQDVAAPGVARGVGLLAARVAEAVVVAQTGPGADYEPDHPYTVQLLAAVSAHAPTPLVAGECAEGDCRRQADHQADRGPESGAAQLRCPVVGLACRACSQVAGGWAGEWEGTFLPECTIPSPCEVLRALAGHYGIEVPR